MFYLFIGFVIFQRLFELRVAKRNEEWMKSQGAIEYGEAHYGIMKLIHTLFFISYITEVFIFDKTLSTYWPLLLALFLLTQSVRVWALTSLGRYWNTKIIVLPNANPVKKGPYQYLKHPNYVIVTAELIIIPFMFEAYITALIFSILNAWILSVRIPEEEKALTELTNYEQKFEESNRFIPKMLNKCDN